MAEQVKVPDLNGGVPINDPTNGTFYIIKDGLDYPIEFESLFRYIYRKGNFVSTGLAGQVVTYSEPFLNVKPFIDDPAGVGYNLVSWNENGFVIDTYGIANFGYNTIKDR